MEPVKIGESVVRGERGNVMQLRRDTPWPEEIIVTPRLIIDLGGDWVRHDLEIKHLTFRALGRYPRAEYDVIGMTPDREFLHCRQCVPAS
mgnify:FL=1